MTARRQRWVAGALLLGAGWQFATWGWIEAKAWLAYGLIDRAWAATLVHGQSEPPWPWADTWPVARLVVPGLRIERAVLHGASGRTLAFGPGWDSGSSAPGRPGTVLISGHRDTHFRFLQQLRDGDRIELQWRGGVGRFRVAAASVIDSRTAGIVASGDDELLLVTCYPFGSPVPGGPLRYVVTALPEPAGLVTGQRTTWAASDT